MDVIVPIMLMAIMLAGLTVLPVYFAFTIWRVRDEPQWLWWLRLVGAAGYLLFVLQIGRWDFVSYHLRPAVVVLLAIAAVPGWRKARRLPWRLHGRPRPWLTLVSEGVVAFMFWTANVAIAGGRDYPGTPVRLAFPLRSGSYYIGQGGDHWLLNYHNGHRSQRFALDILALNPLGARATRLVSTDLERYEIFGAEVLSPCDGRVLEAVDGLEDNVPPATDRANASGNHVIVRCAAARVVLAHLQSGSVRAIAGSQVGAGEVLGLVGNSGNTTEPHLHVHAVGAEADILTGDGVPMVFEDGIFPVRNTRLDR